ncbi:MAG: hypothetical protein DWQ01_10940 [Planctomycetota bacterium]|nr:MAG: hypothetical protein DWQ01_10940 [Planctomycetota bacterium]
MKPFHLLHRWGRPSGRNLGWILALALTACGSDSDSDYSLEKRESFDRPPVLVIGVDGMDWSVLEPLMAAGETPNLRKLVEEGVGGELRTSFPTFSPVIWTSIATGVDYRTHGILHFSEIEKGYKLKPGGLPYTSNCRKVPAIWTMADMADREVLSVAWWVSWPAEALQNPNSRIVASYTGQAQARMLWKPAVHDQGLPQLTWPAALQGKIRPQLAEGSPQGPFSKEYDREFGVTPSEWKFLSQMEKFFRVVYHTDRTHLSIMRKQLQSRIADLNLVYFGLPDVAGHQFWRYHEPEAFNYNVPREKLKFAGDFVNQSYRLVDRWVGELLQDVPLETRIMLLSDHGMHAANVDNPKSRQSGAHEDAPPGVMILWGPDVPARGLLPKGERNLGNIYEVMPTLLAWLDLPPAIDQGREAMRQWMSPSWQEAHPADQPGRSYLEGYRAATPPIAPPAGAVKDFQEDVFNQMGYAEALDPQ